ncbi:MAG: flagellar basal body P-ring formation protein FlgA [Proteobacteria bacterium]|nr:MAG: flagellar basal body P-ring formation protein FlgA [Pseudomonadota bacterium]
MKVWLFSLLLAANTGVLYAQPVDLLQQLYGKKTSPLETLPSATLLKDEAGSILPLPMKTLTLSMRDRYESSRERLFLSDLMTCKGSKEICDEIAAIDAGITPKPMRQERFTRAKVLELIEKEFPGQSIQWVGGDSCQVIALAYPIKEDLVMKVVAEEFEDAPAGMRVIIQSVRVPTLAVLRHTNYTYKIRDFGDQVTRVFQNPRTRFAQLRMLAVDQDPSSQSEIEFLVQVSMRIEVEVLVAKDYLERGDRLTEANVELQWTNYQDQVFSDSKPVLGKLLKTRVQAGNPLRAWDLAREPEILRGDRVEAIISGNGLKINGVAQALEQGFIGQKIRIRLESTKKTITGKVIARSQVEVPSL